MLGTISLSAHAGVAAHAAAQYLQVRLQAGVLHGQSCKVGDLGGVLVAGVHLWAGGKCAFHAGC